MSTALSAGTREKPSFFFFLMAVVNNAEHPFRMERRRRGRMEGEDDQEAVNKKAEERE